MHAGDRIAVTIGGQRFTGFVEEIGPDLIALRCVFGRVDIHVVDGVSMFIEINDKAHERRQPCDVDAHVPRRVARTRRAHDVMTVGTLHEPEGLDGTLFVGADFVSVVAKLGAETVVPLQCVDVGRRRAAARSVVRSAAR